jgi:hypothetical protein
LEQKNAKWREGKKTREQGIDIMGKQRIEKHRKM